MHWAHRQRKDGKRSPAEVLGFLTSVRHRPEDLERAFFSTRFTRVLDSSGYARIRHWKIYAEEGLANREVLLWLGSEVLTYSRALRLRSKVRYARGPGSLPALQTRLRLTLTCPSWTILVPSIHVTGSSSGESVNVRPSPQV
jgi:hypothetical protein